MSGETTTSKGKKTTGWRIPLCSGNPGRSLIVSEQADEVISKLNAVGSMDIFYDENISEPDVKFSESKLTILIPNPANIGSNAGVTVSESDSSPSVDDVTEIRFPNGSVTDLGDGVVEIAMITSLSNPWAIYRSDPTALKFKLTQGYIVTSGSDVYSPFNHAAEHTLSASSEYWCYVTIGGGSATIYFSTTMPTWNLNTIMIGKVVTGSGSPAPATIIQVLAENVQIPCI
ncbi:MAG: hypothetical protein QM813_26420 [Verrucomicrobiota bacterium]